MNFKINYRLPYIIFSILAWAICGNKKKINGLNAFFSFFFIGHIIFQKFLYLFLKRVNIPRSWFTNLVLRLRIGIVALFAHGD